MPKAVYVTMIYIVTFLTVAIVANFVAGAGRALFRYYQSRYLQSVSRTLETMFIF